MNKTTKKPLPLAVTTDENQYRFVGDNSSDFIRLISNEVGKTVHFYYVSWQDVPNEYKQAIYPTLFEFFDLQALQDEGLWEGVKLGINAECARSYKDRKQKAKKHFLANGGYENIEKAKNFPPEYMNQSEWVELIDKLFKSDAYMKRSEKNKANRSKQRYPSFHGSESYSQKRWTEQRIQNEARRLGDNSSSEISDEYDVMKHALGERRGHIREVGRVVKSVPAEMSSSYSTQSQGWQQNWEQQMREQVQREVQTQMNENLHKMQADFARQFEEMRQSFQQQKDSQNEEEEKEEESEND
ncbi:hypothetical protein R6Q59_005329 [Mikania micrantha]